ncbi:hypothetical protein [Streptomyces sp. NPDC006971]|uniref:hypothetical protein n=1 Tax=Streptomyces sp. NPDC006971 TaxID=3154784 RepID=UPI0033E29FE3
MKTTPDYEVVSRSEDAPAGSPWGLDDIGMDRERAVAALIKRAMRWDEPSAEQWLTEILQGQADPEVPRLLQSSEILWDESSTACTGRWFCIVKEGQTPPGPAESGATSDGD